MSQLLNEIKSILASNYRNTLSVEYSGDMKLKEALYKIKNINKKSFYIWIDRFHFKDILPIMESFINILEMKNINIQSISEGFNYSRNTKILNIICSKNSMEFILSFLLLLATNGNSGHSFDYYIGEDADSEFLVDNAFGYDGDGSDRIINIKENSEYIYKNTTTKSRAKDLLNNKYIIKNKYKYA